MADGDERTTEFNSALFALERVDTIKKVCHEAKASRDYDKWLQGLYLYLSEVCTQMSQEKEDGFFNELTDAEGILQKIRYGHEPSVSARLFKKLYRVESALERFYDSMGNKYKYVESRREVSFDEEELKDLSKYGGGGDWVKMNKN